MGSQIYNSLFMRNKVFSVTVLFLLVAVFYTQNAFAQKRKHKKEPEISIYDVDTLIKPIPLQRSLWHSKIDKAQRGVDASDGKVDGKVYYGEDEKMTDLLTQTMLHDVDKLQIMIENLPFTNSTTEYNAEMQTKIRYLTALNELLRLFNNDPKIDPVFYKKVVVNFKNLVIARQEDKVDEFVKENANLITLANNSLLEGYPEARTYLYTELGRTEPLIMIKRLAEFAKYPYADETIKNAAKLVPNEIYNYASSSNYVLSNAIRRNRDPLVQSIVQIAQESRSPLKAMPFLSDIYNKKLSIAEVDRITGDQDLFYKNLVRLKLENPDLGNKALTDEIQYRGLKYIREMNDLHESPDNVRFKCIEGFTPEELYFIMVYGQDEIYTSSFLGTFKRMQEGMGDMKGDELFAKVHYDKFRTFIRMCAGYNTLSKFLATMDEDKKTALMKDFIANLDKGKDNDLEDAVDVADAFGSINDSELMDFLRKEVKANYELAYKNRSKKGMKIYALLSTLFDGLKSSDNDAVMERQSQVLDLPPINLVRFKNLEEDSTGVVYEQFFFYGDEDGKMSYNSFLGNFKDGKWKITPSQYWTVITSTTGKPITIFANLPLPEPEDEEAQKKLAEYLLSKEIYPTIIVHRGHSYHLPLTIDGLNKHAKIVMLGSCGGYHNLGAVLEHSPDANIISSKQTGAMAVNEPIIKAINTQLLVGQDVNWINMWNDLGKYFTGKGIDQERFSDYVPPHKNLGAIFIKAYRKLSNAEEASNE